MVASGTGAFQRHQSKKTHLPVLRTAHARDWSKVWSSGDHRDSRRSKRIADVYCRFLALSPWAQVDLDTTYSVARGKTGRLKVHKSFEVERHGDLSRVKRYSEVGCKCGKPYPGGMSVMSLHFSLKLWYSSHTSLLLVRVTPVGEGWDYLIVQRINQNTTESQCQRFPKPSLSISPNC